MTAALADAPGHAAKPRRRASRRKVWTAPQPNDDMTPTEFREWKADRRYASQTQMVADLCAPPSSLSNSKRLPPDITRMCRMIALLHDLAATDTATLSHDDDRDLVAEARGLLATWGRWRLPSPRPETRRDWHALRDDRMLRLAAAVTKVSLGCRSPALEGIALRAHGMVLSWGGEHG